MGLDMKVTVLLESDDSMLKKEIVQSISVVSLKERKIAEYVIKSTFDAVTDEIGRVVLDYIKELEGE